MGVSDGESLVGRLDARVVRAQRMLEVKGVWWEPGQRVTAKRKRSLQAALERLAAFVGAELAYFEVPSRWWIRLEPLPRRLTTLFG